MWSQIEPATAIICACLVTYRPLFRDLRPGFVKLWSSLARSRSSASGHDEWEDVVHVENGIAPRSNTKGPKNQDRHGFRELDDKALDTELRTISLREVPCRVTTY